MTTLIQKLKEACTTESAIEGFTFVDRKENATHYPFAAVWKRTRKAAAFLQSMGIQKGDSVAILLPTCIEFMDIFLGAQFIGAIPVPLYPPMRLGKLDEYFDKTASMLEAANVKLIVTNPRIKRILGQLVQRYAPRHGIIIASDLQKGENPTPVSLSPDDIAMAQFSSGTTQNPKPVALTHRQTLSNVVAIYQTFPDSLHHKTGCSWLPLYHDMGLIGCIFPAISIPGRIVLISPEIFLAKPSIWLRTISKYKAFISPAPNFAYSLCTERIKESELDGVDLSCWKMALNGAEPVAPEHLRKFIERFQKYGFAKEAITPVYGLAEASLALTFSRSDALFTSHHFDRDQLAQGTAVQGRTKHSVELASVGKPLSGFFIEIRDQRNRALPNGKVGTIWAKGPSLTSGYLNNLPSPILNGWLNTGDIGFFFDEELFISGREKDVLVIRGQNHSPYDIEHAVDSVSGVRTGCSVAVSHISEEGERLFVFVEYRTSYPAMAEDCKKAIVAKTGICPDLVLLLEGGTLPRTSSGKLRRNQTLQKYLANQLIPPKKVNSLLIAGALAKSALGYLRARR
ncbi:MAG: fatty acyl-AMP ligase [Myxococcota bacterium]|nr:fatty acyl-AMP ligase [Myxococcota bacterium]